MIEVTVIKRAGRKFWEAQWLDPVTKLKKRRSTKQSRKREAERFAARLEIELNNPVNDIPVMKWSDFRQLYEDQVYPAQSINTQETTKATLNAIEEILKPARLQSITTKEVLKFRKGIRDRKVAEFSVKRHLTELRKILRWAVRNKLLAELPQIDFPKKVTGMKGRPITQEEFERMLEAASKVLTEKQLEPWCFLLRGLWWSGLRIGEAMALHWTDDQNITVDLTGRHPMFLIKAHAEKGRQDRQLPMAPQFAEQLLSVPEQQRRGFVFKVNGSRSDARPLQGWVTRVISKIGKEANIKVSERGEKVNFATAHDLRRSFGFRWSRLVLPPVLMEMMRHESIQTTQEFYVGRNAEVSAAQIWSAYSVAESGTISGTTLAGTTFSDQSGIPQTPDQ